MNANGFAEATVFGRIISIERSELTRSPQWIDVLVEVQKSDGAPKTDVKIRAYEQSFGGVDQVSPTGLEYVIARGFLCGNPRHTFVMSSKPLVLVQGASVKRLGALCDPFGDPPSHVVAADPF